MAAAHAQPDGAKEANDRRGQSSGGIDDGAAQGELEVITDAGGGPQPTPSGQAPVLEEDPCEYSDDMFSPTVDEEVVEDIVARHEASDLELEGPRMRFTWRDCGDGWEIHSWIEDEDEEGGDPVGPLIEQALASVRPSAVDLEVQPPAQPGVIVGLPAYYAIDDDVDEQSATASAGAFTVTATVRATELSIDPGVGGDAVTCPAPGTRYRSGQPAPSEGCTYVYTDVPDGGAVTVSSHLVYAASYTVDGPMFAGTFDLGTFSGPATETDVTVRQVRAVRTS